MEIISIPTSTKICSMTTHERNGANLIYCSILARTSTIKRVIKWFRDITQLTQLLGIHTRGEQDETPLVGNYKQDDRCDKKNVKPAAL